MAIEIHIEHGTPVVDVPEGTRPFTNRTLERHWELLRDVYLNAWKGPREVTELAEKHQRPERFIERAFHRVVAAMGDRGPVEVLSALRI